MLKLTRTPHELPEITPAYLAAVAKLYGKGTTAPGNPAECAPSGGLVERDHQNIWENQGVGRKI